MANFFTDNDDLRFYFEKGIPWEQVVEITEYGFRAPDCFTDVEEAKAFYRDIAELVGRMVAEEINPRTRELDEQHPRVEDGNVIEGEATQAIFKTFKDAELHRLCLPRELNGLNCPMAVYFFVAEMIARADTSTMTHFSFHGGIAMALLAYSVREGTTEFDIEKGQIRSTRFAEAIEEMTSGETWGCMDITEPNAGSDMAALRTRGEQDEDGNWYVTGQKIFITSGHGKYHLVIARTEPVTDPDDPFGGLGGLSMFLVQAYEDLPDGTRKHYANVGRVEEKLGHNASATCEINFERSPAELIGERGDGFGYMLILMNGARVGVSFEAIGVCEAAARAAREYAEGRPSMGKNIAQHEMIADYLEEMEVEILAMRAMAVRAQLAEEAAQKIQIMGRFLDVATPAEKKRIKDELPKMRKLARRLTPLLKYYTCERSVDFARRAIQIHGGVGYTKEFGVEKLLRDAMVLPIYEGTSQIQSLMAMKDTLMGIIKDPATFARATAEAEFKARVANDPLDRKVAQMSAYSLAAQRHLLIKTASKKAKGLAGTPITSWAKSFTQDWDPKRDFSFAMLHAERLTLLLSYDAITETLALQVAEHPERREILEVWLDRSLHRAKAVLNEILSIGEDRIDRIKQGAFGKRTATVSKLEPKATKHTQQGTKASA